MMSMSKEKKYFIEILSDYILCQKTHPDNNIIWEEIMRISRAHCVTGIVYHQCMHYMPQDIHEKMYKDYIAAIYLYENRKDALKKVESAFHDNNIESFTVKGPNVAFYYPNPALRTMGDLDIIIRKKDREKADNIMRELGYIKTTCWDNKEQGFTKNNIHFEIHDRLIYKQKINKEAIADFFEDPWLYAKNGKIDPSFHLLYLLIHLRKHLMNAGVGFRMFMDIAIICKNELQLDWDWIKNSIEEMDIKQFAELCFGFIEKWFCVPSPLGNSQIDKSFFEEATESIFVNGIFGYGNEDNNINVTVNEVRNSKHMKLSILKDKCRILLPTYEQMRNNEYYHFIDKKAWLLPIAWIYRLYRSRQMIKQGKKNVLFRSIKPAEIKARDKYLKNWGL